MMGVVDVSERTLYLGWVLEVGVAISVMGLGLGVGGWVCDISHVGGWGLGLVGVKGSFNYKRSKWSGI